MSDLSLYQLEDNVWDEFDESGDHIVPCPASDMGDLCAVQNDSHKKPRHEVISVTNDNATKCSENENSSFSNLTRNDTIYEKDPSSCKPGAALPASCNSDKVKEVTNMTSNDTRMSDQGFMSNINSGSEFCSDDAILDGCAAVDETMHHYPLSHISQSENDFTFLNNDHGDKDSNNLFYDGWPDIGDFEDIDKMFSDSTLGLGSLPTEEELCWFSSSHVYQESDATKCGFNGSISESNGLKVLSESHEASKPSNAVPLITSGDDSSMIRSTIFQAAESDSARSVQMNVHNKQFKHDNQSEGRMKDRCAENAGSFIHCNILEEFADVKHPLGDPISHDFSSTRFQHQQNVEHSGLTCVQGNLPDMHVNFSHPSNQFPVFPTLSPGQSENGGDPSPSAKSSYASNQMFSVDSAHVSPHSFRAMSNNEKGEKSSQRHNLQAFSKRSSKRVDVTGTITIYNQDRNQNQMLQSDGHNTVEAVSTGFQAGLDSKSTQESSSTGSALNDRSLEAVSFHQLQQVMEKLDIRTKLCIRDGLYRLARSAEKRHSCDGCIKECRGANGALMAQETDKCTEFMDIETSTNPIDRSIAHLLFHNPIDASGVSGNDAASLKSHAMVSAPIRGPVLVSEKQVCQEKEEETSSRTDENFTNEAK